MSKTAKRLKEMGVVLPKPATPVANYVPSVRAGSLLFVSGQLPLGKTESSTSATRASSRPIPRSTRRVRRRGSASSTCWLRLRRRSAISTRLKQVVRLGGFFSVETSFDALGQAMNGASNFIVELFGEKGRHARTTIGVAHLPLNALAEVEAVFEIKV